jgi:hypothetical protein
LKKCALKKRSENARFGATTASDLPPVTGSIATGRGRALCATHSRDARRRNPQAAFEARVSWIAKCRTRPLFSLQTFWLLRAIRLDKIIGISHLLK